MLDGLEELDARIKKVDLKSIHNLDVRKSLWMVR